MLLGEFQHSLDAKGRVFLPARWREELGSTVVVAKGLEGCLSIMSPEVFEQQATRLDELPFERRTNRSYSRLLFSGSSEESVDKQGRVTIPAPLRDYAELQKDVVLVGVSRRAEVWSKQAWERYRGAAQEQFEQIAEDLEI